MVNGNYFAKRIQGDGGKESHEDSSACFWGWSLPKSKLTILLSAAIAAYPAAASTATATNGNDTKHDATATAIADRGQSA